MSRSFRASLMLTSAWMVASALSSPVFAQGTQAAQPTQSADNAQANVGLAEIVVTAQKRSQNVQDAPLTITAVSGDAPTKPSSRSLASMSSGARKSRRPP